MKNELYLKYAEVIKMCKGTKLEATPWVCVKVGGVPCFITHPTFRDDPEQYEFALAIVEDKPVFIGDVLYNDMFETQYIVEGTSTYGLRLKGVYSGTYWETHPKLLTWKEPKKQFKLGDYFLPYPRTFSSYWVSNEKPRKDLVIGGRVAFHFNSIEEAEMAKDTLIRIFRENLK